MSGNAGRSRGRRPAAESWEPVASWYDGWVGDRESIYHRKSAIPAVLELLEAQPGEEILDVGAGQGVLAPYIAARGARYTGIDLSQRLIALAQRRHGRTGRFHVGDARSLDRTPGVRRAGYDAAVFLLSIQDMDPLEAIVDSLDWPLRRAARVVILKTHPAYRQPRHAGWGFDPSRGLTHRRVDAYLSEMAVPMESVGRDRTVSFHRPISVYVNALARVGFAVDAMVELPDLPTDLRPRSRRSPTQGTKEIPLFLGLRARRP